MASLQKKGDSFYCQFVYQEKRYTFTIGEVSAKEAGKKKANAEYLLLRLRQNLLRIPAGCSVVDFIRYDGEPPQAVITPITLGGLRQRYLAAHEGGELEVSTREGMEIHFRHLIATFSEGYPLASLSTAELQRHVDRRAKAKGRKGRKLSPATIKKELVTLRTAWNWAANMGYVAGRYHAKGLRYPKTEEPAPFQTMDEIKRYGGDWKNLYLQPKEVEELLTYVKENGTQPWVYPMMATAAHTGARRAELLRMMWQDVHLIEGNILMRERKKAKGKRTTRNVPLSNFLRNLLQEWREKHPGGAFVFVQPSHVVRSRTKRDAPTPVTRDEAHDHLQRTLKGSKWEVVAGYHLFRHSFISALVAKGVDQRIVDDIVGHTTDEQRKRYRHLTPDLKQSVIDGVFG